MSLAHAILGFLELEPTTGYTLRQRFEGSVGSFWSATQSQIYRELHDLERRGLVDVETIPQEGKPPRKVYRLLAPGRAELESWRRAPVDPPQIRDPLLLKLVFAAETPPDVVDDVLKRYADDLEARKAEYEMRLSMKEIFALARSDREALLWKLSIENGIAWCDAQLSWAFNARKRLQQNASRAPRGKQKRR